MRYNQKIKIWLDNFKEKHNFNLAWFIRYALGGTATAIVELAAYVLFLWWRLPWDIIVRIIPSVGGNDNFMVWAIVVSNIISYIFNYFVSKYWVFHSPETKHRRDATLFLISSVANLLVVLVSSKCLLMLLGLLPFNGELWDMVVTITAKIGSNVVAFITVLLFKRFIIWNDTSKY